MTRARRRTSEVFVSTRASKIPANAEGRLTNTTPQKIVTKTASPIPTGLIRAVKQENVHDDRSENRECERHVVIDQKQRARNYLKPRDDQEIFRNEHRSEELSRDSAGRRHRYEMKKSIQTEDPKDQTQKEPTDVS